MYLLYLVLPYLHDFVMRIIIIIKIGILWEHLSNVLGMYLYDWNLKIIFEMFTFLSLSFLRDLSHFRSTIRDGIQEQ